MGVPGPQGPAGPAGVTGALGSAPDGVAGPQGLQGDAGIQGGVLLSPLASTGSTTQPLRVRTNFNALVLFSRRFAPTPTATPT